MSLCSVDLAKKLIRFRSLNPPGEEKACVELLADFCMIPAIVLF